MRQTSQSDKTPTEKKAKGVRIAMKKDGLPPPLKKRLRREKGHRLTLIKKEEKERREV